MNCVHRHCFLEVFLSPCSDVQLTITPVFKCSDNSFDLLTMTPLFSDQYLCGHLRHFKYFFNVIFQVQENIIIRGKKCFCLNLSGRYVTLFLPSPCLIEKLILFFRKSNVFQIMYCVCGAKAVFTRSFSLHFKIDHLPALTVMSTFSYKETPLYNSYKCHVYHILIFLFLNTAAGDQLSKRTITGERLVTFSKCFLQIFFFFKVWNTASQINSHKSTDWIHWFIINYINSNCI